MSDDKEQKKRFGLFRSRKNKKSADDQSELSTEEISEDIALEEPETVAEPETVVEKFAPTEPIKQEVADEETQEEKKLEESKKGFFARLKTGLSRSSSKISDGITGIFTKAKLDDEMIGDLEDLLITSDLGVETVTTITRKLAAERFNKDISAEEVKAFVAGEVANRLAPLAIPFKVDEALSPHVVLVVGVNGSGKTTTIGKMAKLLVDDGKSVMLCAADTFRAAAIEQLKIWGERVGAPVIARETGTDAAALAFDALAAAKDQNTDVLLIDTAGRLQNKADLMSELEKIVRVIRKQDDTAPHSVLLVLDATVGQNAISQTKVFKEIAGVTGLMMTKLDGTARGGILVALAAQFDLPIHAIGVGESIEDFQPFDAQEFADALVGREA